MPRLYLKPGVDLNGLAPGGCRILSIAALAPLVLGFDQLISCGKEGHGPDDPHTHGDAVDLRTRDHSPLEVLQMISYYQQQLGTDLFTVLFEVPEAERASIDPMLQEYIYLPSDPDAQHLHLQVRKGRVFPIAPRPV